MFGAFTLNKMQERKERCSAKKQKQWQMIWIITEACPLHCRTLRYAHRGHNVQHPVPIHFRPHAALQHVRTHGLTLTLSGGYWHEPTENLPQRTIFGRARETESFTPHDSIRCPFGFLPVENTILVLRTIYGMHTSEYQSACDAHTPWLLPLERTMNFVLLSPVRINGIPVHAYIYTLWSVV